MASALKTGRDALREALAGADEQLATRKPRPSSWSILECVEHPVVSERQSRRREAMIAEREQHDQASASGA